MDLITKPELLQTIQLDAALETPAGLSPPADTVILQSRDINSWIERLPAANRGEHGPRLLEALKVFNRTKLPTLVRAEAVELSRERVRELNSHITKQFAETGFPLVKKAQEASRLIRDLNAEIAGSYKIIIKEQLETETGKFNQKLVIVAVHRAIEHLGEILLHSYLSYTRPGPGIWRQMHALYAWAVQNQVHSIPVKETHKQSWNQESPCIEDLYKCQALLSTTSPQRLRQSQIHKVHDQLGEWSKLTRLVPLDDLSHTTRAVFVIDCGSDNPPFKLTVPSGTKQDSFLAFDLGKLIASLQTDLDKFSWESPAHTEASDELPSRSLLKLLIQGWTHSLERRFARRSLNHSAKMAVGFNRVHHLLDGGSAPPGEDSNGPPKKNGRSFPGYSFTGKDADLAGESAAATRRPGSLQSADSPEPRESDSSDLITVHVDDESIGGYRLNWRNAIQAKVRVGDILAIQANNLHDEFIVGIVRWLRHTDDFNLHLGVQTISAGCDAATLGPSPADTSSDRTDRHQCILLSSKARKHIQPTLIIDGMDFKLNAALTLVTGASSQQIMLTDRLESTCRFSRYRFKYLDDAQAIERSA